MRVFVLFPMMLLVVTVQGSDAGREDPQERPRVLCGRMLANARMIYCFGKKDGKRSSNYPMIVPPQNRQDWLWRRFVRGYETRVDAEQHALTLRGQREPGLVDECCLKPCYTSELLSYC